MGTQVETANTTTPSAVDAIEFVQAGHQMYVTSLTAEQLISCTTVDPYDSSLEAGNPAQGYQRPPERSRITRIGSFLIKNHSEGNGLYPTAVLLGARKPLRFDPVTRRLQLPNDQGLRIIDGQHRTEGLRYAIYEKGAQELAFLPIPVVIVEIDDKMIEMEQFKIINGTAKQVRVDLVNAILTAIASTYGADAIPEKEQWKVVVTKAVDTLNRRADSPWMDRLLMPDEIGAKTAPHKITRATSAITSIRLVYEWLREFGFLAGKDLDGQAEYLSDILIAYWRAIRNVVPDAFEDPGEYVIQKTPGLFSLHYLLREVLLVDIYRGRRSWDEPTFEEFLAGSSEITDASYWHRGAGGAASYGSMKGFRELADLLKVSVRPD